MKCGARLTPPLPVVLPRPAAAVSPARSSGSTTSTLVVSANPYDRASGTDVESMSGSDVLRALEKATAHKGSKKKKKKMKVEVETTNQSSGVASPADKLEDVRPLRINAGWAARLDKLEECLNHLSRLL